MKKFCIVIMLIMILTDQTSKLYISLLIDEGESIELARFIKIVEVWNSGISFGMFNTLPYNNFFFSVFSIIITSILIYLIYKSNDKLICFSLSLIIGGATGNIIDRVYWGAVYDFIYFHIGNWYWPVFNLADVYISCGMFILLYKSYIYDKFVSKDK